MFQNQKSIPHQPYPNPQIHRPAKKLFLYRKAYIFAERDDFRCVGDIIEIEVNFSRIVYFLIHRKVPARESTEKAIQLFPTTDKL